MSIKPAIFTGWHDSRHISRNESRHHPKNISASPFHLLVSFFQAGPGIVFAVQNGKNILRVDSFLSGGSAEAQVAEQV